MSTHELHLDAPTCARAKRLAEAQQITVEQLVSDAIQRLAVSSQAVRVNGSLIGALADASETLDEIVEEAHHARERFPLRQQTDPE